MSVSERQVFAGTHLRALLFGADCKNLLVTFDHREKGKTDFGTARTVRQANEKDFAVLRIQTRRNDWFINSDTIALEECLTETARSFERRNALGFSMGGYGVFRFAAALKLDAALAISPQYSVAEDVVPWDPRFHAEAPDFDSPLGDLAVRAHEMRSVLLVDPFHAEDLRNAEMIAAINPRTRIQRLGFGGHPASVAITRHGKGGALMAEALNPSPNPAAIRRMFRQTCRQSPVFLRRLARASDHKRPHVANWARQRLATLENT